MAYSPQDQTGRETKTGVLVLGLLATMFVAVASYRYFQTTQQPQGTAGSSPSAMQPAVASNPTEPRPAERRPADRQIAGNPVGNAERYAALADGRQKAPAHSGIARLPRVEDDAAISALPGQFAHERFPQQPQQPLQQLPYADDARPLESYRPPAAVVQRVSHQDRVAPGGAALQQHAMQPLSATVPATPQRIVVGQDDSFWNIALRQYGAGAYYKALFAYNSLNFPEPDRLLAGGVIIAPPVEELRRLYPQHCPAPGQLKRAEAPPEQAKVQLVTHESSDIQRTYLVQPGDDLFGIATRQLGEGQRWTEIYRLNAGILNGAIEQLPPGIRLKLPE